MLCTQMLQMYYMTWYEENLLVSIKLLGNSDYGIYTSIFSST